MTLPVPSQRTWAVADIVTAAMMNANVRDAVNFLESPPLFFGWQNIAQSFTSGTFGAVTFDSEIIDTYNGHSTASNTSRYVAQVAGWYLVVTQVGTVANTAGFRAPCLFVNGVAPAQIAQPQLSPSQSGNTIIQTVGFQFLNVGDYVEVRLDQTSGGALSSYAPGCTMAVIWIHT